MCCQLLFVLFILTDLQNAKTQESVHYLQNAMWDLENRMNTVPSKRRIDSLQLKSESILQKQDSDDNVPMLSLTKAELAALYEAALSKEHAITSRPVDHNNTPYIQALVHEMSDDSNIPHEDKTHENEPSDHTAIDSDGYYYYYYPINSFMDGFSSSPNHAEPLTHHDVEDEKLYPQYHSHTHQHNVHITKDVDKKKVMEPLFMAVSSFIGMAVMFILSILFLPKFGGLKSRGVKHTSPGDITTLSQIIFKAIDGDDCSERVVCELGKAAKALKVYDNRFVKLFKRMSPAYVGWYVDGITKYAQTNLTCAAIQCRRKTTAKLKPMRKKF